MWQKIATEGLLSDQFLVYVAIMPSKVLFNPVWTLLICPTSASMAEN
jgi:hypothetical protein